MSNKMNPEIKQKWVEALRSGEYTQGSEALYRIDENSFCCLGVLCDIRRKELNQDFSFFDEILEDTGGEEYLPRQIVDWAEFSINYVSRCDFGYRVEIPENKEVLDQLNDDGVSFLEIADKIEKYL